MITVSEEKYDDIIDVNDNNFIEIVSSDNSYYEINVYVPLSLTRLVNLKCNTINIIFYPVESDKNSENKSLEQATKDIFYKEEKKSENIVIKKEEETSKEIKNLKTNIKENNSRIIIKRSSSLEDIKKTKINPTQKVLKSIRQVSTRSTNPFVISNISKLINFEKVSPVQSIGEEIINLDSLDEKFSLEKYGKLSTNILTCLKNTKIPFTEYIIEDSKQDVEKVKVKFVDNFKLSKTVVKNNNKIFKIVIEIEDIKGNSLQEVVKIFDISNLILAHESFYDKPQINVFKSSKNNYILTVLDNSSNKPKYSVFKTDIKKSGEIYPQNYLGTINPNTQFNFFVESDLSLLRVFKEGKYIRNLTFSEVVLGEGFSNLGTTSLIPYQTTTNCINLKITGLPERTFSIDIFRRTLEKNDSEHYVDSNFDLIFTKNINKSSNDQIILDDSVIESYYYEYYARCNYFNETNVLNSEYTKPKLIKARSINKDQEIIVEVLNIDNNSGNEINFDISTQIEQKENEKLTNHIRQSLDEIYQQLMNPISNNVSAIDISNQTYGVLIFHEIVRHNLTTGESENFGIIRDGKFSETANGNLKNIKRYNPLHDYEYQIFTFKKDPYSLFKNFVKSGEYDSGDADFKTTKAHTKKWSYLPYKWSNVSSYNGILYPQDENTNETIISEYEKLTNNFCGTLYSKRFLPSKFSDSFIDLKSSQIDRDTIMLSISGNVLNLDYSIVCIMINGNKKIIGITHDHHFFYDLKKDADYGDITFFILPIFKDLSTGTVKISNTLTINPFWF